MTDEIEPTATTPPAACAIHDEACICDECMDWAERFFGDDAGRSPAVPS